MQLAVLPTKIELIVSLIFILLVLLHTSYNSFFQLNAVCTWNLFEASGVNKEEWSQPHEKESCPFC